MNIIVSGLASIDRCGSNDASLAFDLEDQLENYSQKL
jgi:hypothetical protein